MPSSELGRDGPDEHEDTITINQLRFPKTLLGRDEELNVLNDIYYEKRVLMMRDEAPEEQSQNGNENKKDMVIVSGYSGTGKTSLVVESLRLLRKHGDYFVCSGKFDLFSSDRRNNSSVIIPYAAIVKALSELVGQLLRDDPGDREDNRPDLLRSTMSREVREIVVRCVPAFTNVLLPKAESNDDENAKGININESSGSQATTRIGTKESTNQFNFAFRALIRNICLIYDKVLILFIDDLQWADQASLELIEVLVTDIDNPYLLFVGSYRDNEVSDDTHPLSIWLEGIEERSSMPGKLGGSSALSRKQAGSSGFGKKGGSSTFTRKKGGSAPSSGKKGGSSTLARKQGGSSAFGGKQGSAALNVGSVNLVRLSLDNLSERAVNDLISDTLNMDGLLTRPLAQTVHSKTDGNVFFVKEFLIALVDDDLLKFNFGTFKWSWDLDSIDTMYVTSNVADLTLAKLRKLPTQDCQVLSVSSCLGASFDLTVLTLVVSFLEEVQKTPTTQMEETHQGKDSTTNSYHHDVVKERLAFIKLTTDNVEPSIQKNLSERLLELASKYRDDSYRFSHDQIQQAAFTLIPEESRSVLQWIIGQALVKKLVKDELSQVLFGAVDLLNSIVLKSAVHDSAYFTSSPWALPLQENDVSKLAELNLAAGKKALAISAFRQSAIYLRTAIKCIEDVSQGTYAAWAKHHDFCLDAYQAYADSLYCNGDFDKMYQSLNMILQNTTSKEGRMAAYSTLVDAYGARDQYSEAFDTGFRALAEFGDKFPRKAGKLTVLVELLKIKRFMKKYPMDTLRKLPELKDKSRAIMMKIFVRLIIHAQLEFPMYFPLLAFRLVKWSCVHGISSSSPPGIATYGLVLASALGDLKGGYDYAMIAMDLMERIGDKAEYCFTSTCASIAKTNQEPVSNTLRDDLLGYQVGMEKGESFYGMLSLMRMLITSVHAGQFLVVVAAGMKKYVPHFVDHGQMMCYKRILPMWQFVLILMEHSSPDYSNTKSEDLTGACELTGEVMNEHAYLEEIKDEPGQVAVTLVLKQILSYYQGNYALAAELSDRTQGYTEKYGKIFFQGVRYAFFDGLTALVMLQTQQKQKGFNKRKWLKRKKKSMQKMSTMKEKGNVNAAHMLLLLEAEEYTLERKIDMNLARSKFDAAIALAGKAGFVHDNALANERAGAFFAEKNDSFWANVYITSAHNRWAEYGALAICGKLEKIYPQHVTVEVKRTSTIALKQAKARASRGGRSGKNKVFKDASESWSSRRSSILTSSDRSAILRELRDGSETWSSLRSSALRDSTTDTIPSLRSSNVVPDNVFSETSSIVHA